MLNIIKNLFRRKLIVYYAFCHPEAKMLFKAHEDDACWDVFAASLTVYKDGDTKNGKPVAAHYDYGTGLKFAIPKGYEIECRPRSSGYVKTGMLMVNAPATIDCGYTGEVHGMFTRFGFGKPFQVGDRIMQIKVPSRLYNDVHFELVDELPDYGGTRGDNGFGSTGGIRR